MDRRRIRREGGSSFVTPITRLVDLGWWGIVAAPIMLVALVVGVWIVGVMSDALVEGLGGDLVEYGEQSGPR